MVVSVSGHQPTELWGLKPDRRYSLLRQELARRFESLIRERQAKRFLFGMSLGADCLAFDACVQLRKRHQIELVAAVPCNSYSHRWAREQHRRHLQRLARADSIVYVDEIADYTSFDVLMGAYHPAKLLARNQYLVDHANTVFAIWGGVESGNTYDTVCRAREAGKELVVFNPFEFNGR